MRPSLPSCAVLPCRRQPLSRFLFTGCRLPCSWFVGLTMKMLVPLVYVRLTEILPTKKAVPAVAFVGACSNFIGQFGGPLVAGYLKHLGGGNDMTLAWGVLGLFSIIGGVLFALAVGREERIWDIKPAFRQASRRPMPARE